MTALNLNIENLSSSTAPLFCHYDGQSQPQPAKVYLDPRSGDVWADYSGEIGNAVSCDEWNHLITTFPVEPNVDGEALSEYLQSSEFKGLAQIIIAGFEEIDGKGCYDFEADNAIDEICTACNNIDIVNIWYAPEWLEASLTYNSECLADATEFKIEGAGTITADTSDEQLDDIYLTLFSWIDTGVVVADLESYLAELRTICTHNV